VHEVASLATKLKEDKKDDRTRSCQQVSDATNTEVEQLCAEVERLREIMNAAIELIQVWETRRYPEERLKAANRLACLLPLTRRFDVTPLLRR
jgi:superfamily I DNA and RNA helicase